MAAGPCGNPNGGPSGEAESEKGFRQGVPQDRGVSQQTSEVSSLTRPVFPALGSIRGPSRLFPNRSLTITVVSDLIPQRCHLPQLHKHLGEVTGYK